MRQAPPIDTLAWADDPLERLEQLRAANDYLAWMLDRAVCEAKGQNRTWAEIGKSLGVSRQAAHQRFGVVERFAA